MKNFNLCHGMIAVIVLAVCSITSVAQTEKYLIRIIPKPKTTTTLKMVQETDIDMAIEGGADAANAVPPIKILGKTNMTIRLKTGDATKAGHVPMEITYEDVSSEMTMNGNSVPTDEVGAKLEGKTFSVTYDDKGNIVDLKTGADFQMPEETLKEMLRSVLGAVPLTPIGVGESAASPLKLALPLPIPSAGPLNMEGSIKSTLVSVEKAGQDRIAKLEQVTEARMVNSTTIPGPDGKDLKMEFDLKMSGGGGSRINLDQGTVQSSDSSINLEGKFGLPAIAPQGTGFAIKGTIKISVTGGN